MKNLATTASQYLAKIFRISGRSPGLGLELMICYEAFFCTVICFIYLLYFFICLFPIISLCVRVCVCICVGVCVFILFFIFYFFILFSSVYMNDLDLSNLSFFSFFTLYVHTQLNTILNTVSFSFSLSIYVYNNVGR